MAVLQPFEHHENDAPRQQQQRGEEPATAEHNNNMITINDDATTPVIANLGGSAREESSPLHDNNNSSSSDRLHNNNNNTTASSPQQQHPPPLELPKSALEIDAAAAAPQIPAKVAAAEEESTARFSCSSSPPIVLEQWPHSSSSTAAGDNHNQSILMMDNEYPGPATTPVPRTISVNRHRRHKSLTTTTDIRGIPNYGQTCFLNAVLQSLASLTAFDLYLSTHLRAAQRMRPSLQLLRYEEAMLLDHQQHNNHNRNQQHSHHEDSSSPLFLTQLLSQGLHYINGVGDAGEDKKTSSSSSWDPRLLLDTVAQSHPQFQASHLQQDAQELLTALLDALVQEQDRAVQTTTTTRRKQQHYRNKWLRSTMPLLPATPEPEAITSFAYTPPATVWALSPAFVRLQLSAVLSPTDEEATTAAKDDEDGAQPWKDVAYDHEDDMLSVASSAREHARQQRRERRLLEQQQQAISSESSSPVGGGNEDISMSCKEENGPLLSLEKKTSPPNHHHTNNHHNGTAMTSLSSSASTTTQSPPTTTLAALEGEEKKQDAEFEVHVPRVHSEEDFVRSSSSSSHLLQPSLPQKPLLSHHLDRTRRIQRHPEAEEDATTAVSDLTSSSVVTLQSSAASQQHAQQPYRSSYNGGVRYPHHLPQPRAADRLAMPLCGWMGSTLQCRKCHYVRPIHNVPFVDLSIVPSSVGDPHNSMNKGAVGASHRPCTVEECLSEFTKVERVEQVDCPSCTKREQVQKAQDEVEFWEFTLADATAIHKNKQKQASSNSALSNSKQHALEQHSNNNCSSSNDELQSMKEELERHRDTLQRWQLINCDDECCVEQMAHLLGIEDGEGNQHVLLRQDANKCLFLTRLPPVFCLHVQRRYYDPQTARLSKTTQPVLFEEFLNVAPYCAYTTTTHGHNGYHHNRPRTSSSSGAAPSWVAGKSRTASSSSSTRRAQQQRPILYRLMAVLEHRGGANCGHYVCYRRAASSSGKDWLYVSDHVVRKVPWKTVRQCQAYMLFYENSSISE